MFHKIKQYKLQDIFLIIFLKVYRLDKYCLVMLLLKKQNIRKYEYKKTKYDVLRSIKT